MNEPTRPLPMLEIVFDPTDRDRLVFLEVEDGEGNSVSVGEWHARDDGLLSLRLRVGWVAPDFLLAIGDDVSDEDLERFRQGLSKVALVPSSISPLVVESVIATEGETQPGGIAWSREGVRFIAETSTLPIKVRERDDGRLEAVMVMSLEDMAAKLARLKQQRDEWIGLYRLAAQSLARQAGEIAEFAERVAQAERERDEALAELAHRPEVKPCLGVGELDAAQELLRVMRELDTDGLLCDVYGIGDDDPDEPLAAAVTAWEEAGYPGSDHPGPFGVCPHDEGVAVDLELGWVCVHRQECDREACWFYEAE